jgi:hypothetical protein
MWQYSVPALKRRVNKFVYHLDETFVVEKRPKTVAHDNVTLKIMKNKLELILKVFRKGTIGKAAKGIIYSLGQWKLSNNRKTIIFQRGGEGSRHNMLQWRVLYKTSWLKILRLARTLFVMVEEEESEEEEENLPVNEFAKYEIEF